MTRHFAATIGRALDRLQFGAADRFFIARPPPIGLGGQIAARQTALRAALALDRRAIFPRVDDPPYTQTFAPLCLPLVEAPRDHELPGIDIFSEQKDAIVVLDALKDVVQGEPVVERYTRQLIARRLGLPEIDELLLRGAIFAWMSATEQRTAQAEADQARLGVDDRTLGVHVRRGDKQVETPFVPASEINKHIRRIHELWRFESIFLASDSPRAVEEIRLPPGVRLIFDAGEKRYNNANHKMLLRSPELAEEETKVAYKNIFLLSACGGIVGQSNAHFAKLAAGIIALREGTTDRIALIDGRIAERHSPSVAALFRAKTALRAAGRRLFPQLTMSARMARARSKANEIP